MFASNFEWKRLCLNTYAMHVPGGTVLRYDNQTVGNAGAYNYGVTSTMVFLESVHLTIPEDNGTKDPQ